MEEMVGGTTSTMTSCDRAPSTGWRTSSVPSMMIFFLPCCGVAESARMGRRS